MRKLAVVLSALAGLGLTQAASAADLPAKAYTKAPPVVSWGWTGSYIGGYIGGATYDNGSSSIPPVGVGLVPTGFNTGSSFIGGLTTGYNLQFAPNWLIGYESETGYEKIRGTAAFTPAFGSTLNSDGWYNSWTARFGYVDGRSLYYVKGGATLTSFNVRSSDVAAPFYVDHSRNVLGYAIGGGWEYKLDQKWSVKAEYQYLGFENDNYNVIVGGVLTPASTHIGGIHTAKVGVNYKWDPLSLLTGFIR